MWKLCGYIIYSGTYPITAKYLIYDQINNGFIWTDDSNNATIFSTIEHAKIVLELLPEIDSNTIDFRSVIMTDEPVNK